MKLRILILSTLFACTGSYADNFQITLEKAKPEISGQVKKSEAVTTELNKTDTPVAKPKTPKPPINMQKVQTSHSNNIDETSQITAKTAIVTKNKQYTISDTELEALEKSLAGINDTNIMSNYGPKGSGIPLNLKKSSIPLVLSKRKLVSDVKSVNGATSIIKDSSGFGFLISLSGDYLFEFDKDTLTPKAQKALVKVLTLYQDYDGTNIKIEGHTDSKGNQQYNLDLSKRRAESVKTWFKKNKISNNLIGIQGFGEAKPIAKNSKNGKDFPIGRALNRRVDIIIKTKKKVNHLPTVSTPSTLDK